jgi:hypothetical protein
MKNPATKLLQCVNTRPWVSILILYTIQSDEQLWRSEEKQNFESKHLIAGCMSGAPPRLYGYNLLGQKSHCLGVDSDLFNCSQWTGVPILSSGQRTGICPLTKSCP